MKTVKNIALLLTFCCAMPVYTQGETPKQIATQEEIREYGNALAKAALLQIIGVGTSIILGIAAITALSTALDATISSSWTNYLLFWSSINAAGLFGLVKTISFFGRTLDGLSKKCKNNFTNESCKSIEREATYRFDDLQEKTLASLLAASIIAFPLLLVHAASHYTPTPPDLKWL